MKKDLSQKGAAIWIATYQWHVLAHSFLSTKHALSASKASGAVEKPLKNSSP